MKNRFFIDGSNAQADGGRFVRLPDLLKLLGISRSTVYARMDSKSGQYDPSFPKSKKLNTSSKNGAVGWLLDDIHDYINKLCDGGAV